MSAFVVFAIVITLLLLVYYAIMIALDLKKLGKQPSSSHEEFDVSDMQEENTACEIDEKMFRLPETEEQKQEQEPVVTHIVVQPDKPSAAEASITMVEEKLETIEFQTSCYAEVDDIGDMIEKGTWIGGKFRPQF